MYVEDAEPRRVKDGLFEDLSVSRDNADVWPEFPQLLHDVGLTDRWRLAHRESVLERE